MEEKTLEKELEFILSKKLTKEESKRVVEIINNLIDEKIAEHCDYYSHEYKDSGFCWT